MPADLSPNVNHCANKYTFNRGRLISRKAGAHFSPFISLVGGRNFHFHIFTFTFPTPQ